ncbi:MAG TPA: alpha/beta hydrolase-fold protein [Acidimicrobiales bacterium]
MLSRRGFLIGVGAAGAVAVGGYVEAGASERRRLLHHLGLAASPDHRVPPSATRVVSGKLDSTFMRRTVGWSVSMPDPPLAGVVYCLHGKGDDHRFAFDTIHLHDVAAAQGARLAVAAVDGGADSYWHPRADGTDALGMLVHEFVPMVEREVGPLARRALIGWSMGGYGALLVAETTPQTFSAVAAASPALWLSAAATAPGAFDDAEDYRRHDVVAGEARLARLVVRVDCGQGDPFYRAARSFAAGLPGPPQTSFGPGYHDAAYWRSVAPAQIATIMGVT